MADTARRDDMTTKPPTDPPPPDSPRGRFNRAYGVPAPVQGRGELTSGRDALRAIAQLRGDLDDQEAQIVFDLRFAGTAWEAIVAELGITCEAARERFTGARVLDQLSELRASRSGGAATCSTAGGEARPGGERRGEPDRSMGTPTSREEAAHDA